MNNPATLLIIDTSTKSSVLGLKTPERLYDFTTKAVNSHSREILPLIEAMMTEAGVSLPEVDAYVFGQGPGSFTGLRIAAGIIQGLAYGLQKPVAQVSTMAALAQSQVVDHSEAGVCVALTARLDELYFGAYRFEDGLAVPVVSECVEHVSDLPTLDGPDWIILGDSRNDLEPQIAEATKVTFSQRSDHRIPRVEDLLSLGMARIAAGDVVPGLEVTPVYLREEVASKPAI